MSNLQLLAPITKHEKLPDGRMMIEGIATSEDLDRQAEIIDYDTAKAAFQAWGGNIREMHDPKKAVGRAVEMAFDDETKQVVLKAFISAGAADTQKKIEDGTLSMFSIGGKSKGKTEETVKKGDTEIVAKRVLMERISEVSVVDSGANPAAGFEVVKADGAIGEMLDGGEVEKTEDTQTQDDQADDVAKAGARNNKADQSRIQEMHDHAAALGAKCGGTEKADSGDDLQKIEAVYLDVQKMARECGMEEGGDVAKFFTQLWDDLSAANVKIQKLEAMPTPMKGPIRVITKSDDANPDPDAPDLEAEADRIAKSNNPALELIKMVHRQPQRIA